MLTKNKWNMRRFVVGYQLQCALNQFMLNAPPWHMWTFIVWQITDAGVRRHNNKMNSMHFFVCVEENSKKKTCIEFTFMQQKVGTDRYIESVFCVHSSQFTYKILCDVQMHSEPFTILMEIGYFSANTEWNTLLSGARMLSACINLSPVWNSENRHCAVGY